MDQKSYRLPLYFSTTVCYDAPCYGDVAQLEERDNRTVEVRGSSPLRSTTFFLRCEFGWYHGKSFRPAKTKGFFVPRSFYRLCGEKGRMAMHIPDSSIYSVRWFTTSSLLLLRSLTTL